jgi:hypothetical protein
MKNEPTIYAVIHATDMMGHDEIINPLFPFSRFRIHRLLHLSAIGLAE